MDRRFLIFGAIAVSAIAIQSPAQARGLRLPFGAALRGCVAQARPMAQIT